MNTTELRCKIPSQTTFSRVINLRVYKDSKQQIKSNLPEELEDDKLFSCFFILTFPPYLILRRCGIIKLTDTALVFMTNGSMSRAMQRFIYLKIHYVTQYLKFIRWILHSRIISQKKRIDICKK